MITPIKAVAVFDRQKTSYHPEELLDSNIVDYHVVDIEELIGDLTTIDNKLQRSDGASLDLVLFDSALPSESLMKMIARVQGTAPNALVMLLPKMDVECAETQNNSSHAHTTHVVLDAIRYARERERLQRKLLQAAFKDDLTGMHNRRGFRQLAMQQLRLARGTKQQLLLFFADLDGLKQINDNLGHRAGDQALKLAAAIFKKTFRKGDVTARIGGDEFVALVMEEPGRSSEQIRSRLLGNLRKYADKEQRYPLSLSVGVAHLDPNTDVPLKTLLSRLMAQADDAMYVQKRIVKPIAANRLVAALSAKLLPSSPIHANANANI
jgi:diguanylate cyclase (GGDEF)-like protein